MEMTTEAPDTQNRYSAADVVTQDLDYICNGLKSEFADLKPKLSRTTSCGWD